MHITWLRGPFISRFLSNLYFAINISGVSQKKKAVPSKPAVESPVAASKSTSPIEKKIPEQKLAAAPMEETPDFFTKLGNRNVFVVLGILLLLVVLVFNNYLFGDRPYCFVDIASDTINLSYPNMANLADYITQHGLPKWSFRSGMGQSIFPFFLRDPFELILLLQGKNAILGGLVYLEVIKIILAGLSFYWFLRLIKVSEFSALLGTLFFSFSGFMVMGSAWYGFTYEVLCLALFLVAFELLYQRGSWWLLPIVVCCIALSMPFNLYVYGLFVAAYGVFRHFAAPPAANSLQKIGITYLQMIGVGLIGLLLAGPFLLENIVQILESPRGSGNTSLTDKLSARPMFEVSEKLELATNILRFFSNDILGSAMNFKGWKNILEAGSFYCGLPCLLLMPQVFPFLEKKARTVFIVFISLWILPMFFPYFRHAFWLFSGDYYRAYAFFVALVFILYSVYALDFILKTKKINLVLLIGTVVVLLALLNYPYFEDPEMINGTVKSFAAVLLLGYAVLLFFIAKPGSAAYLRYVLLGLVVFELSYVSGVTTNNWEAYQGADATQKIGYNDYTLDALRYIKQRDKSFYRVDKSYGSSTAVFNSINDGMAQGFYGSSSYNPFNQLNYIKYMQLMGVSDKADETATRWCLGLLYKPVLESANSVKYILAKNRINPFWRFVCDSMAKIGDVTIFKNKYALPLGYTFSSYMKESDFAKISEDQRSLLALKTCVVSDEAVPQVAALRAYPVQDTTAVFDPVTYGNDVQELGREALNLTKFSDNEVAGKVTVSQPKMLYISIPYDAGWTAKVDGKVQQKMVLSAGMTGLLLPKGEHTVVLTYDLRYYQTGLYMSLAGGALFVLLFFITRKKGKVV
jgi:hypothetical protein